MQGKVSQLWTLMNRSQMAKSQFVFLFFISIVGDIRETTGEKAAQTKDKLAEKAAELKEKIGAFRPGR